MGRYLLLGAGFSRNWGGWLAPEIYNHLLGRVVEDRALTERLLRLEDFEAALAEVQRAYVENPVVNREPLATFQAALTNLFAEMNRSFEERAFEFSQFRAFSITEFLARFDAIFSLNQDLLLEMHYRNDLTGRWAGVDFVGMQPPPNWWTATPRQNAQSTWRPVVGQQLRVPPNNVQPIYKLHGSINWTDSGEGQLLVMGGNKSGAIRSNELLTWYGEQFIHCLSEPDSRLMIIGYGYQDAHINAAIYDAWQTSRLAISIVDPKGRGALRPRHEGAIRARQPLEEVACFGVSIRLLSDIFGGDDLEYRELMRFFR